MKKKCTVYELVYKGVGSRLNFFLGLRREIKNILHRHPNIKIIHFNDAMIACFYSVCGKKFPVKHTVTLHGLDVVFPSWIYRKFIFPQLNSFDLLLPVSKATAAEARLLGINKDKIHVVHNGVDESIAQYKFSLSFHDDFYRRYHIDLKGKHLLIALGRPVKRKGFSWFIEHVMPLLNKDYLLLFIGPFHSRPTPYEKWTRFIPEFLKRKLDLFLGAPSDEAKLRKLLALPPIRKRAKHLGRLPLDEILNLLHHATAFIMPNIAIAGDMEGFGLVCLEAALCGTTVLASNIGGIPDAIVDGKNGYLLPHSDAAIWAERLNNLMQQELPIEHSTAFKHYTLENYSWEKMVNGYYSVFTTLAASSANVAESVSN
ncbi:glycosyltransferase family 4 protein [Olivibacter sp. SDN3]|uniref:glycosyltransferase family 4 protein n=1 Tax=Olivibacter sp. SDN3 TaxID=2764720 RepID=UPI00165109AF|nr:glycosyltransferase family 4 protein [Olivibacter sp. SDN3]QNL49464.1 glycosyltransferase family 4 protein [Olivibacter sp. SDN3]